MQAQAAKKDLTITYNVEANVPENLMGGILASVRALPATFFFG